MGLSVFYAIDTIENVNTFYNQIKNNSSAHYLDKFINYHTPELIQDWLNLFPPPDIWQIWNRWNSLPSSEQERYVLKVVKNEYVHVHTYISQKRQKI